jgi:predicted dehydrogenase
MSYQRDFKKRLRVALVGVGSHAYRSILPALHFLPIELKALCDLNVALAESTAAEYGVSRCYESTAEMYRHESLDAVLLCVSPMAHPVLACEALRAGLHVWMEKPAASCLAEVDMMTAAQGDLVVTVGYKKAFMPAIQKVREVLALPTHRPVRTILAQYPVAVPKNGPMILRDRGISKWLSNGCHPLSFLLAIGGPVAAVTTHHGRTDDSVVVLEFASGALGTLHGAMGVGNSQPAEVYTIYAEKATLTVENGSRVRYQRGIPFEYGISTSFAPPGFDHGAVVWEAQNSLATLENNPLFTQGIYGSLLAFCEQALGAPRIHDGSLAFARELTAVYEASLLSGGQRQPIVANS